jgi:aspartyl-tRNA(Asn)/glutamyl-tRNA(Gln) amidotransferase subunit B
MQRLVRWLGASHANMQMGHMRFEPNINLHITRGGETFKTPIVEVKNLNSFRALEGAVAYEVRRQYDEWLRDPSFTLEKLGKQNRGWDDAKCQTVFQREKEEAHDYRYFPDPDLVPVLVEDAWRERVAASVGELPLARRRRYMEQHRLSFKEADALTQDAPSGNLLDDAVKLGANPKRVTNFLLGRIAAQANNLNCTLAEVGVSARELAELGSLLDVGKVTATASDVVLSLVVEDITGARLGQKKPRQFTSVIQIAEEIDVLVESDPSVVQAWVEAAIAANPGPAEQVRSGAKKAQQAFGFLVGAAMKASGGKAPPALVKELLEKRLKGV